MPRAGRLSLAITTRRSYVFLGISVKTLNVDGQRLQSNVRFLTAFSTPFVTSRSVFAAFNKKLGSALANPSRRFRASTMLSGPILNQNPTACLILSYGSHDSDAKRNPMLTRAHAALGKTHDAYASFSAVRVSSRHVPSDSLDRGG